MAKNALSAIRLPLAAVFIIGGLSMVDDVHGQDLSADYEAHSQQLEQAIFMTEFETKSQSRERYCFAAFQATYRAGVLDGLEASGSTPYRREERLEAVLNVVNSCVNGRTEDPEIELLQGSLSAGPYSTADLTGPSSPPD